MSTSDEDAPESYTPDEQRTLTERLLELTRALHAGSLADRPLDLTLIRHLHGSVFEGVRAHAGRHRTVGQGSERVTFGPHRSSAREDVERELEELFEHIRRRERSFADLDDEHRVAASFELAVWAHARLIRIHPFEDGNGRVGRLCATHLLVRHGHRAVAVEAVKQEYTEALNHYYVTDDLEPLVDLFLRLSPVGR